MNDLRRRLLALLAAAALAAPAFVQAQERSITVASTTSTEQSGLFGHLLPAFTGATGIAVKVVAVGTTSAAAAMRMWCSCTTGPPRTGSSRRASRRPART